MNKTDLVERPRLRRDIPPFRPGDTVKVHVKVAEAGRERVQVFEGVVIRRRGSGLNETFTVRKVSYGVGVERNFPVHAPVIDKVEITQHGRVRRSKLYYLRERTGRHAKIRERRTRIAEFEVPEEPLAEEAVPEEAAEAEPEEAAPEEAAEAPVAEAEASESPEEAQPAEEPKA